MKDAAPDSLLDPVLARIDADLEASLERLMTLLRIPSISTDPAYSDACLAAADWLVEDLRSLGFDAVRDDTPGHPMVLAHGGTSREGAPHLLFYGHYDVQPVDPLELWHRDPFDPALEDGPAGRVLRGRGAADDKGQLMTFVEACRAWKAVHGSLPTGLTLFFEGEEESGSPSLVPYLTEKAEALKADVALICDTGLYADTVPTIITQLRGMLQEEIIITGPNKDLHSGAFGGPAANPLKILSKVLASLHDETGRVTIPGFYDGVPELTEAQAAAWSALEFDHEAFLGSVGLKHLAGEQGRSALEMLWSRPTAEINGIAGGYAGEGFKTVLPSVGRAKISCRLVGTQDPEKIGESFREMVRAMVPDDCTVEFIRHGASPASVMDTTGPVFEKARQALTEEWGREAVFTGAGGSIPVAGYFKTILGLDSMLAGWGKDDDQIHSPNEKYDVDSFHKGMRSWARILAALR